jgi:hypothetical protein
MKLASYRDLIAWQKGLDLCEAIYNTSSLFPQNELYGLTSQIRRAAVSVPSNIAEGAGKSRKGNLFKQSAMRVARSSRLRPKFTSQNDGNLLARLKALNFSR